MPTTRSDSEQSVYVPFEKGRAYWVPEEPPANLPEGEAPPLSRYTFMATAAESHGELTVIDTEVPAGNGPPEHVHDDADESFYGIEGEFWFRAGDKEFTLRPRDFAFVRRGTVHLWKNLSDRPARMLRIYTPSGHENFFFKIGRPALEGEEQPYLTQEMADHAEQVAMETYGPRVDV